MAGDAERRVELKKPPTTPLVRAVDVAANLGFVVPRYTEEGLERRFLNNLDTVKVRILNRTTGCINPMSSVGCKH